MHLTQELELFPEYTVTQLLFKDVKNATELRKMAVNGEIKGALINPSMISEAFKRFGISDSDSAVHIVLIHNKDETLNIEDIIEKVDGQQMAVDRVSDLTDVAKIKKLYKVAPQEEKCGSLLDAVVCRMATKDVA
ncbi:hypothetical protein cypCar_00025329 [Cyprinus carpio]|nr:hypothetical protein cypCar_00025329 [Cyprinus carpio]